MTPVPERWVRSVLGPSARLVEIGVLPSTSHTNDRLRVETREGAELELLLRRYTDAEFLASDPWYAPTDEVSGLRALERTNLPVPRLIAGDVNGGTCEVPTLLLTWLPGEPPGAPDDLDAFERELADPLPAIHAIDVPPSCAPTRRTSCPTDRHRGPPTAAVGVQRPRVGARVRGRRLGAARDAHALHPPRLPPRQHRVAARPTDRRRGLDHGVRRAARDRPRAGAHQSGAGPRPGDGRRSSRPGGRSSRASRRTRSGTCSMPSTGWGTARRPT